MSHVDKALAARPAEPIDDAARLRAFIQQEAVGIAEMEPTGRFIFANRTLCAMLGFEESALRTRRLQDLASPNGSPESAATLATWFGNLPYRGEKQLQRCDGTPIWVYLSVTSIHRADGEAGTVLAIVLDISERHRAEAAALSSAQRYQGLFNSMDAGFCVIELVFDAQGRPVDYIFRETNARFEVVSGLTGATGARMRELAPQHEEHWFNVYGGIAVTGEPVRFEQEAKALKRWFSVFAFRLGEPQNREVAIVFEDITTRKLAEQRRTFLAELAEKLSALRDETEIVQATVEAVGPFLDVERCFFVECHESENRVKIGVAYTRPGSPPFPQELSLFDFGGMEWWHQFARGDFAVNDVMTDPLTRERAAAYAAVGVRAYCVQPFKEKGEWTVVLAAAENRARHWTQDELKLLDDVTARVWPIVERARHEHALLLAQHGLEQRVEERTAKLQETIAELESYSYSISHDLRSPLRAIQTYARILAEESSHRLESEAQEYLRRIIVSTDRMDRLIRDVLVYSRVARERLPVERIELGSFIASVIETYPGLSDANAEIELVNPLRAVKANPAALTQCVSNLLGNAIKFTPADRKPKIRVWSELKGDFVRVYFRDNGLGVPAEERERIFGIFYRLDQSKEGTGVGLAVVRKAAERMGGSVGVADSPGLGATFWLELPAAKGD